MYQEFDIAIAKVLELLKVKHKSKQPFAVFKNASTEFKKYLTDKDFPYSLENATEWLRDGEQKWTAHSFIRKRRALFLIENCIENQTITTWNQKFENKTRFQCLPDWAKTIVEEYLLDFIHPGVLPKSIKEEKRTITNFLTFIASQISSLEEITHGLLVAYYRQDKHKTQTTKQVYNVATRQFLRFLEKKQLIPEGIHKILEWDYFSYVILVDELPEEQQNIFLLFASEKDLKKKEASAKALSTAKETLRSYLNENNYESTTCSVSIEVFILLNQFMQINDLAYSPQMSETWLGLLKNRLKKTQFRVFRRSLKLLESIMLTGEVETGCFVYKPSPLEGVPSWCRELVVTFLADRTREGKSPSTIKGDLFACIRFLRCIDIQGVSKIQELTPQLIMEFSAQDIHKTPSSKNCFNGKIRNFLHFLASLEMIPISLTLAMTSTYAETVRIVKVLSSDQKQALKTYIKHSSTPMELRNAAMISLGLNLGLRACDVINLRFSDVIFFNKTVSLIQQKTGVPIRLPLPTGTGNSIYRYIREGRPQAADSPYIFVPHQKRNSNKRLKTCCACSRALFLALSNSDSEIVSSFHVLRKTFASNLLAANNPVSIIASALGHSGIKAVDPYLETDKERMGLCPIGLSGIELEGGRL